MTSEEEEEQDDSMYVHEAILKRLYVNASWNSTGIIVLGGAGCSSV